MSKDLLSSILRNCDEGRHPSWARKTKNALARLRKVRIRTVEDIEDRFYSLKARERKDAVYILSRLGKRNFVSMLLDVIQNDVSLKVRIEAAEALGWIGGKRAMKGLWKVVENQGSSHRVRWQACYSLAFMFEMDTLDLFIKLVSDNSEHPEIRSQAAEGIANLLDLEDRRRKGWRRSVDALIPCLDDSSGEVRFWVIFALGILRAKQALSRLRRLARSDRYVGSMRWPNFEEAKDAIVNIKTGNWPEPDAFERSRSKK